MPTTQPKQNSIPKKVVNQRKNSNATTANNSSNHNLQDPSYLLTTEGARDPVVAEVVAEAVEIREDENVDLSTPNTFLAHKDDKLEVPDSKIQQFSPH